MSKGNKKRGDKEAKKPKQEKPKVAATSDSNSGNSSFLNPTKKSK